LNENSIVLSLSSLAFTLLSSITFQFLSSSSFLSDIDCLITQIGSQTIQTCKSSAFSFEGKKDIKGEGLAFPSNASLVERE
jgi:hypothetical protein